LEYNDHIPNFMSSLFYNAIVFSKKGEFKYLFCFNSLTAKSVPTGTKNSRSEGFLLAKPHKHPHHDGAIFPSGGVDLMNPRRLRGGWPCAYHFRGRHQTVLIGS
jgi:hypothetical protein